MDELKDMSAIEIGKAVNNKQISPTEVLQYFEKRIEEENPKLNAIVYTKFDEAYERAKELEKELEKGEHKHLPLAGVPFALKDFLPSKKGWTNTHGGVKSLQAVDSESSEFCKAMESLGGIAIGKTNAPSFGFSGLTDNKMYGATRNPFNTKYNSGGSSGGSASAVGGKLLPVAEGGDGGGSIRVPSAWCNCVGYKPSVGRVPSVCRPDAWTATHPYCFNGCITRSVKDSALIFDKMFRYNPRDPLSVPITGRSLNYVVGYPIDDTNNLKGIVIGYTYDWNCFKEVDSEIVNAIENAIKKFESLGVKVIPVSPKIKTPLKELSELWCRSISIDTAYDLEEWKKQGLNLYEKEDELPEGFLDWQKIAINSTVSDYKRFNEIRTELLDMHEDLFEKVDFIVSPVTVINPVENGKEKGTTRINSTSQLEFAETFFQNFTGHPACSLPCGFTKEGLPIGIQVVGKKFRDSDMFYLMSRFYN